MRRDRMREARFRSARGSAYIARPMSARKNFPRTF